MTAKAKTSTSATSSPGPVVLFGIDSRGKPKAARFGKDHAALAIKAAGQLKLRVLDGIEPKVAEIVGRLPVGRVHATGRMFVPFVRRDLYDKFVALALNGNHQAPAAPLASTTAAAGEAKSSGSSPNLPRDWDSIGLGDLVVAQESLEDGWYEAIVMEAHGDMLTLRWRDYPRERRIVRHRHRVGLLYPGERSPTESKKSAKPTAPTKTDKSAVVAKSDTSPSLPKDWQEIDVNHLVLAKDDGPWRTWWEAVPVEKAGDLFKLRWRDYASIPNVTRQRFGLALIRPTAA